MHHADDGLAGADATVLPVGVLPEAAGNAVERRAAGERVHVADARIDAVVLVAFGDIVVLAEAVGDGSLERAAGSWDINARRERPAVDTCNTA